MPHKDISMIGETNLDMVLYGLPEEMPCERELLATDFQVTLGGSSAILAHNLATLGVQVGFITQVGEDELGRMALGLLAQSGADLSRAVQAKAPVRTGNTVLLHHGARRRILTYLGAICTLTRADVDMDYLVQARHFHLSSLFLQRGLAPDLPEIFRKIKNAGLTVSLDTNDDPEGRWDGVLHQLLDQVDILLPNEEEACRMARRGTVEEALRELSRRVPCVVAKCGPRGALVQTNGKLLEVPPVPVQAVDTIGAGDSFNAGFLYAYLQGRRPEECAQAGNVTGALSTLRPGGTGAFRDAALRAGFFKEHPLLARI